MPFPFTRYVAIGTTTYHTVTLNGAGDQKETELEGLATIKSLHELEDPIHTSVSVVTPAKVSRQYPANTALVRLPTLRSPSVSSKRPRNSTFPSCGANPERPTTPARPTSMRAG